MPAFEYCENWDTEENFPTPRAFAPYAKKFLYYKYKDASGTGTAPGSSRAYRCFQIIAHVLTSQQIVDRRGDSANARKLLHSLADGFIKAYPNPEHINEHAVDFAYSRVCKESFAGHSRAINAISFARPYGGLEYAELQAIPESNSNPTMVKILLESLKEFYPDYPMAVLLCRQTEIGNANVNCCANYRAKYIYTRATKFRQLFRYFDSSHIRLLREFTTGVALTSGDKVCIRYEGSKQKKLAQKLMKFAEADRVFFTCETCEVNLGSCRCVQHRCGCFATPVAGQCGNRHVRVNTIETVESPIVKSGTPNRRFPRHIGVEIEISSFLTVPRCTSHKAVKVMGEVNACVKFDGSLERDGAKEITTAPKTGKEFSNSLARVIAVLQDMGGDTASDAGIHMHIDVSDFEEDDFRKLTGMWAKMEKAVLATVPRHRRGNSYCQSWEWGDKSWDYVTNIEHGHGHLSAYNLDDNRYKTLNYKSYNRSRKTVEFRFMESTLDAKRIKDMASILSNIVEAAKKHDIKTVEKSFNHSIERTFGLLPRPVTNRLFTQIAENV